MKKSVLKGREKAALALSALCFAPNGACAVRYELKTFLSQVEPLPKAILTLSDSHVRMSRMLPCRFLFDENKDADSSDHL
jgi:hypothetical protein